MALTGYIMHKDFLRFFIALQRPNNEKRHHLFALILDAEIVTNPGVLGCHGFPSSETMTHLMAVIHNLLPRGSSFSEGI